MKCKVSKTILKEIINYAKQNKEKFGGWGFYYCEMPISQYEYCVDYDGIWGHEIDYDDNKNVMKVLKVVYPYDYYACDKYLTTKDLQRVLKNASDRTLNGFLKELENEIDC